MLFLKRMTCTEYVTIAPLSCVTGREAEAQMQTGQEREYKLTRLRLWVG